MKIALHRSRLCRAVILALSLAIGPCASRTLAATELDAEVLLESAQIEGMLKNGQKVQAVEKVNLLWSRVQDQLAATEGRVADLSLLAQNPLHSREERSRAETELRAARAGLGKVLSSYGLVAQVRAGALEKSGIELSEQEKALSRAYEGLTKNSTMISMAAITAAVGTLDKPGRIGAEQLINELESAARAPSNTRNAALADVLSKRGEQLKPASDTLRKAVLGLPDFLSAFRDLTGDAASVEIALGDALRADPGCAQLWARRSIIRVDTGDQAGSFADLLIARALAKDLPEVEEAVKAYKASPAEPTGVFMEHFSSLELSQAALRAMLGGKRSDAEDRSCAAARRNYGRRLIACSFISDAKDRSEAIAWVKEQHKDALDVRCNALAKAGEAWDAGISEAGGAVQKLLGMQERVGPLLAPTTVFWKMRVLIFQSLGHPGLTAAALDLARAVGTDPEWVKKIEGELAATQAQG